MTIQASTIRRSATDPYQLARAGLLDGLDSALQDPKLRSISPQVFSSLEDYTGHVLMCGSISQVEALLSHLDTDAALALPELKALHGLVGDFHTGQRILIEYIGRHLDFTAEYLGCDFRGNRLAMIDRIISDFGGLTLLDVALFFSRVRAGRYRSQFQNVATRDLNAEFLQDWLGQYVNERSDLVEAQRRQLQEDARVSDGPAAELTANELERRMARKQRIEADVAVRLADQERDLTELSAHTTAFVPADDDHAAVPSMTIPMRVDKPGAAYRRLHRFMTLFLTQDPDITTQRITALLEGWKAEFDAAADAQITLEDYYRHRSKMLLGQARSVTESLKAIGILRAGMQRFIQDRGDAGYLAIYMALQLDPTVAMGNPAYGLTWIIAKLISLWSDKYWDTMEDFMKDPHSEVLTRPDFVLYMVVNFLRDNDMPNVLEDLFT